MSQCSRAPGFLRLFNICFSIRVTPRYGTFLAGIVTSVYDAALSYPYRLTLSDTVHSETEWLVWPNLINRATDTCTDNVAVKSSVSMPCEFEGQVHSPDKSVRLEFTCCCTGFRDCFFRGQPDTECDGSPLSKQALSGCCRWVISCCKLVVCRAGCGARFSCFSGRTCFSGADRYWLCRQNHICASTVVQ